MTDESLAGAKFYCLTVIGPTGKGPFWNCLCTCGKTTIASERDLIEGERYSCGCIFSAVRAARTKIANIKRTPEYRAWVNMRYRCLNSEAREYQQYGGRGIGICDRWSDFSSFLKDVGYRPSPYHSLGRVNNNAGYNCGHCPDCLAHDHPSNVRWEDIDQQNGNTRASRPITYNGETRLLTHWATEYGIPKSSLHRRLKNGWSMERALTTPLDPERIARGRKAWAHPRNQTRICEVCGTEFRATQSRIDRGDARFCSRACYWSTMKGTEPPYRNK